ncbi:MAG: hypothetical protein ACLFTK_07510 [Anaerolineales bacterium]
MSNRMQRMVNQPREWAQNNVDMPEPDFPRSTYYANLLGFVGAIVTGFVYFGLQRLFQNVPAQEMVNAMHGSSNTLCFAGVTASATIMPLMLTIFSFARSSETQFDHWFYKRIKLIAALCCVAFIFGLMNLTLLSAPITDIDSVRESWYWALYVGTVFGLSTMVGVLITLLILLFYAILHIINQLQPDFSARAQQAQEQGAD